jgi:hypothetical protein
MLWVTGFLGRAGGGPVGVGTNDCCRIEVGAEISGLLTWSVAVTDEVEISTSKK